MIFFLSVIVIGSFEFANAQEGIKFDVSEFEFTNFGRDYKLPIGMFFD